MLAVQELTTEQTRLDLAVANLEEWFESMRGPEGYGGPVAHWWQQSLIYTGPGLDWRYEGIITGYLTLWQRTGEVRWLTKAIRAGNDLVAGQLDDGHYPASAFEINPATAGTPHEGACAVGLLHLALALRAAGKSGWQAYADCAEKNLKQFYIGQLWDAELKAFRDSPSRPDFVPNKAATAAEAFFLLSEVRGEARWAKEYALPNLDRVLEHQVRSKDGRLNGAIAQNSFGTRKVEKYFPIYMARAIPALLRGYHWTKQEKYAQAAFDAMSFILRWGYPDGTFPTVIYPNKKVNRYPAWIAPLGDILRAAEELKPLGFETDLSATLKCLLAGQDSSGGIQTAIGFAAQSFRGKLAAQPDVRDVLHVAGWCDKAFRFLAGHVSEQALPPAAVQNFEALCTFQDSPMHLVETPREVEIFDLERVERAYLWRKGQHRAEVARPQFWLR